MMQIITLTQYWVTLSFNPKFFGSVSLSVVKIDTGQFLIFAGGWGQRYASSINSWIKMIRGYICLGILTKTLFFLQGKAQTKRRDDVREEKIPKI